jgi:LAS superfamily LD-carboxypeptidase LdcB
MQYKKIVERKLIGARLIEEKNNKPLFSIPEKSKEGAVQLVAEQAISKRHIAPSRLKVNTDHFASSDFLHVKTNCSLQKNRINRLALHRQWSISHKQNIYFYFPVSTDAQSI